MPGRVFRILWGTNLENQLDFNWPAVGDQPTFWAAPRPGSERTSNGAVQDAWVTGMDYWGKITGRWFGWGLPSTANSPSAQWAGSTALQAFFNWSSQGNTFGFVPDAVNTPQFVVTGCYLWEPFDNYGSVSLEPDGSQSIALTFWHPTIDLGLAFRGLMFEYSPGADITVTTGLGMTFTRAGAATYLTNLLTGDGNTTMVPSAVQKLLASAASGVLRDRAYDKLGSRIALLEANRTNLLLQSETLGTTWTQNAVTISNDQYVAPDGATTADRIIEAVGTSVHGVSQAITITAGQIVVASGFFHPVERTQGEIVVNNGTDTLTMDFDTVAGTSSAVAANGATLKYSRFISLGNGWWYVWISGIVNAGSTAITCQYNLRSGGASSYAGNTGNGASWWGTQAEAVTTGSGNDQCFSPSSYRKTTTLTVGGAVELFTDVWPFAPQPICIYIKFIETGARTATAGFPTLLTLGGLATWRTTIYGNGGTYAVDDGISASHFSSSLTPTSVPGDTVELLAVVFANGSCKLYCSVNGAADTSGGTSSIPSTPPPPAWGAPVLNVGGENAGTVSCLMRVQQIKIIAGSSLTAIATARAA